MRRKRWLWLLLSALVFAAGCGGATPDKWKEETFPDQNGNDVSLVDGRRPTVVFFFTGAG